jgi:dUTP pyrophosphatase
MEEMETLIETTSFVSPKFSEPKPDEKGTESIPVKLRLHTELYPGLKKPEYNNGNFIDLAIVESLYLKPGEFGTASLGVSMEFEKGQFAMITPRSSTFKKYGILLVNSPAIIDDNYCGDDDIWKVQFYATREIYIPKGTRLVQFSIFKYPTINFIEVNKLDNENRGGIGSTGN